MSSAQRMGLGLVGAVVLLMLVMGAVALVRDMAVAMQEQHCHYIAGTVARIEVAESGREYQAPVDRENVDACIHVVERGAKPGGGA